MSAKKWCITTALAVVLVAAALAAFNLFTDPFGALRFGKNDWYSYSETLNPRVAKIGYLAEHGDEYDAYIVGCSSTSSYPVDALERYTGHRFYNMIVYGSDLLDTEQTVDYLLKHKKVEHIVVNLYLSNGQKYDYEDDPYTGSMHPAVDGSSAFAFYMKYLFADPRYGWEKLEARRNDGFLAQSFDVFDEKSGAYDKRKRDAEPINSLSEYLRRYPEFTDYNASIYGLSIFEENKQSLLRIRKACEEAEVELTVILSPMYYKYYEYLPEEDIRAFYTAVAEAVDFWDFSISSVSYDPRYFYDATHLRNDVGDMAIARIFGDEEHYIPEDFGALVTAENVEEHLDTILSTDYRKELDEYTTQLPILMYHNLDKKVKNEMTVTPARFREHMQALCDAGYQTVTLEQVIDYIEKGIELPENPILVTFDDGYTSNYEYAYPILEELDMHGVIFAVGSTYGSDTYKDTGRAIYPHFGKKERAEMERSGVIEVQSHTYDMHQEAALEENDVVYDTVLPDESESESDYIERMRADLAAWEKTVGKKPCALSYPNGITCETAQVLLNEYGIKLTFCSEPRRNTLVKGLSQSGYSLGRFNITESLSGEQLLRLIG